MIRVPVAWIERMTFGRSIAIIAVVGGGFGWFGWSRYRSGDVGAVIGVAPFVAVVLAVPFIGLVFGYVGWVRERVWAPWQGIYRAFDDHRIRVVEARGALWFSSADVHAALDRAPRSAWLKRLRATELRRDDALGTVLSNVGLVALFGGSTERRVIRFIAWADRDVTRPWQNRRDDVTVAYRTPRAQEGANAAARPPPRDGARS